MFYCYIYTQLKQTASPMKIIKALIPLLLVSVLLFGQNFTSQKTDYHFDTNSQSASEAFLFGKSNIPEQKTVNKSFEQRSEFIWVVDSSYHYRTVANVFGLDNREKVLGRNEFGNPTQTITHLWDEQDNSWINRFNILYSYHETQSRHIFHRQSWSRVAQQWLDTSLFLEYSFTGNLLLNKERIWNLTGSVMAYAYNTTYMYDEDGNNLGTLYQGIRMGTGDTLNFYLIENEINEDGKIAKSIRSNWFQESWLPHRQELYTYDENGNRVGQLIQDWYAGESAWYDYANYIFIYDEIGNQLTEIRQNKNFETDVWYDWWRYDHAYDELNRRIESVYLRLDEDAGELTNQWLYTYEFDENGNLVHYLFQGWNKQTGIWDDFSRELYAYDEHNNRLKRLVQTWSNYYNTWENVTQDDYFWSSYEIAGIDNYNQMKLAVFPNPAHESIYISGISTDQAEVKLYSITGILVKRQMLRKGEGIDIEELPTGTYILHMNTPNGAFYGRFVKQ
jgi:hypothetical protein